MDIISTRINCEINFSDYLIIRRAIFGWNECNSNGTYISIMSFKCALKNSFPDKYHNKFELDLIYYAGIKIIDNPSVQELDFIGYLRIIYYTYIFSILSAQNDTPFLEYGQFIDGKILFMNEINKIKKINKEYMEIIYSKYLLYVFLLISFI